MSKTKAPFTDEDVINLFPICKHINPRAVDATNILHNGQTLIQQGKLRHGFDMVADALNIMNNVYGAMHAEIAQVIDGCAIIDQCFY